MIAPTRIGLMLLLREQEKLVPAIAIVFPVEGRPRVEVQCKHSERARLSEDVLEDPRRRELIAEAFELEEEWTA